MTSKSTPGPWKVEQSDHWLWVAGPDREENVICDIVGRNSKPGEDLTPEDAANARLIAAAPDLLAACKAAIVKFKHTPLDRISVAADMLRDAIAKAEGK